MKIGVVGAGQVGATSAYACVARGVGREIVLIDHDEARARAQAEDILHAVPFMNPLEVRAGYYSDLEECAVVVVAAGVGQRPNETRAAHLAQNAAIFRDVIPEIIAHAPDAVLVIATNPVDALTHLADGIARTCGAPAGRVIGSGTTLDTARFRTLIASLVGIDAKHIHAYVLGEHGDSEVLCWASASVANIPLDEFCRTGGYRLNDSVRADIDEAVRKAAYRIIAGKGWTDYGVGSAIASICDTVINDRRSVLTVSAPTPEVGDVLDVSLSLPRLIGGTGVLDTFMPTLCSEESDALTASARAVAEMIAELTPA